MGTTSGLAKTAVARPRSTPLRGRSDPNRAGTMAATRSTLALPSITSCRKGRDRTRMKIASSCWSLGTGLAREITQATAIAILTRA